MLATSTKSNEKSCSTQQNKEHLTTSFTKAKRTHSSEKQRRVRKNTQPYVNNNSPYARHSPSSMSTNQKEFSGNNNNYDINRSNNNGNNHSIKKKENTTLNNSQNSDVVEFQYPTPLTSEVMSKVRLLSKPEEYIPIHEPTAIAANLALRIILSEKHEQH